MSTLTRRRLLQLFAASGACAVGSGFAATPSWAAQSGNDQSGAVAPLADGDEFDVVIVGGGVSGAYVAWRLLSGESSFSRVLAPLVNARDDKQLKVALLEMSDRIGGRL
jgi:NADH dehydrogenase FAD-containing subunit